MKRKETYIKPEIEVVKLEADAVIAGSINTDESSDSNPGRIKRRNFWKDEVQN